jgi:hypothetical protein
VVNLDIESPEPADINAMADSFHARPGPRSER